MSDVDSKLIHYEELVRLTKEDNDYLNDELKTNLYKLDVIDNYKLLNRNLGKKLFAILGIITILLSSLPGVNIFLLGGLNIIVGLSIKNFKLREEKQIVRENKKTDIVQQIEYLREEIKCNNRSLIILNNSINDLKNRRDNERIIFYEQPMTKKLNLTLDKIS